MQQVIRIVSILAALTTGAAIAHAHAYLDHASPRVGSTVATAPSEVRLWFTQALEPRFSGAQLQSSAGAVVATGGVDSANPNQMVIKVNALPPGRYKVTWHVLSVDTHRTQGGFSFEVKR